jgi:hypothetical protein
VCPDAEADLAAGNRKTLDPEFARRHLFADQPRGSLEKVLGGWSLEPLKFDHRQRPVFGSGTRGDDLDLDGVSCLG